MPKSYKELALGSWSVHSTLSDRFDATELGSDSSSMDAFSTRSVSQRKRSHSTTAYSTSLLAAAAGSQVLTYEFINTQAIQPPANATAGQYEAIQTSNERTEFGVSSLKWSPDSKSILVYEEGERAICWTSRFFTGDPCAMIRNDLANYSSCSCAT